MSTQSISIRVIDRNVREGQIIGLDTKDLDWRILDCDTADSRRVEFMRVEEFRLGLAAVAALAVPPGGSVAVQDRSCRTADSDVGARDGD